ncbi:hypothetical protein JCM1840_000817 [Sporobolomyces johnsonii]
MASVSSQPCAVCGKLTTLRCSKCVTAGHSLFFCSPAHQQILWPSHKRICGPRSNPFQAPLLTEQESKHALATMYLPVPRDKNDRSLAMLLEQKFRVPPEHARTVIEDVTKDAKTGRPSPPQAYAEQILSIVRVQRRAWLAATEPTLAERYDPFSALAGVDSALIQSVGNGTHEPFWQTLRHKFVIFMSLVQAAKADVPPPDFDVEWIRRAYNEIDPAVRKVMKPGEKWAVEVSQMSRGVLFKADFHRFLRGETDVLPDGDIFTI